MKRSYLEVTFRKGKPVAAYLYLPRPAGTRSARTVEVRPSILVDYAENGEPIGLELTAPSTVELQMVNEVLRGLGMQDIDAAELAPLRAA